MMVRERSSDKPRVASQAAAPKNGHALEPDVRGKFEPLFGANLSDIRIHPNSPTAETHNARAVSKGTDLHFGRGEYSPRTPEGSTVLAHELTHSLQQTRSGSPTSSTATLETEAQSSAADVAAGTPISAAKLTAASPSVPLFLKKGEPAARKKHGPKTADVADAVKRHLKKDGRDDTGEATERLDALRPDIRREAAGLVKDDARPEQRTKLNLDTQEGRPPPPAREIPEPDMPAAALKVVEPAPKEAKAKPEEKAKAEPKTKAPDDKKDKTAKPEKAADTAPESAGPSPAAASPSSSAAPTTAAAGPQAAAAGPASAGPAAAGAVAGAAAAPVAEAEPAPPPGPEANPAFQTLKGGVVSRAGKTAKHQPAAAGAAAAQSAAVSPPNERDSAAQANQADTIAAQETNPFNKAAFKSALLAKVEAITPKNLEEADEFKESGKAGELKDTVSGEVTASKQQAEGGLPAAAAAEPNTAAIPQRTADPLVTEEVGPAPSSPNTAAAAPPPRSDAEVSLDAGPRQIDGEMEGAGVTTEQLEKSNEPTFQEALDARQEVKTDAETSPAQFRTEEQGTLDSTKQSAAAGVAGGLQGMFGSRNQKLGEAANQQTSTKSKDEAERARVAGEINTLFATTKKAVEDRLALVEKDSGDAFDKGAETARNNFETYCNDRMEAYKDDRYSGILGGGRWLKDKLAGMPDEVNEFYEEGKRRYIQEMDGVIDNVATIVETGLTEAKALIVTGKAKIHEYVAALPDSLKKFGEETETGLDAQFEQLEGSINDKRDALVDTLAQRYVESMTKVNDSIAAMKEANKGLVDKAIGFVKGVINAIIAIKNMFLNILSRVASCIGDILSDPIGFVGNFFSAVGQGISQFLKNIGKHLLNGLMGWLFGALGEAGIQMPESFDLKGILSLVMQVLGLTYANIRMRAVKILGEKVVGALETTAEVFMVLIKEGPAGLWNWIKDQFVSLKDMVMEGIQSMVEETIIKAGITWLLGMLNPAGAFIKICMMLIDVVKFFIERGKQIYDFVMAVIDSVAAVASGKLDQAANWIEGAMAKSVPVIISFLASLLGLGGISGKIKKIVERIQSPINKIIDAIIKGAVGAFKAVGRAFGFGKEEKKGEADKPESAAVKVRASALVEERLGGKQDEEHIKQVLASVQSDLQPEGLHSLTLSDPDDDGVRYVLASASPTTKTNRVVPMGGGTRMTVRLILSKKAKVPAATLDKDTDLEAKKAEHLIFKDQVGDIRPDKKNPRQVNFRVGSAVSSANPEPVLAEEELDGDFETLNLPEYSNSSVRFESNDTHAEPRFHKELMSRKDIHPSIREIHIQINNSPCDLCAGEIVMARSLATKFKRGTITWQNYYCKSQKGEAGCTTGEGLNMLEVAGFKLTGPRSNKAQKELEVLQEAIPR